MHVASYAILEYNLFGSIAFQKWKVFFYIPCQKSMTKSTLLPLLAMSSAPRQWRVYMKHMIILQNLCTLTIVIYNVKSP